MTKKYLALRVRRYDDIVTFLHDQGIEILQSRLETRDQALRNLTEGLFDQGVERVIEQHELRWMQVKGPLDDQITNSWSLCEFCLDEQWFENYKDTIRHYNGVAYWDATYGLAADLAIKPQGRPLTYSVPPPVPISCKDVQEHPSEEAQQQMESEQLPKVSPINTPKAKRKRAVVDEYQLDLFA